MIDIPTSLPHTYSPEALEGLQEAFEDVWVTLYSPMPQDGAGEILRARLGQTLVTLAGEGITDPQELKLRALERMALAKTKCLLDTNSHLTTEARSRRGGRWPLRSSLSRR